MWTGYTSNGVFFSLKKEETLCKWFMPIIQATPKAEIRRIVVQSQPGQIVLGNSIWKKPVTKKGWWLKV
jgi:CTP:phosphocholine cytidylyltransferase-like protein